MKWALGGLALLLLGVLLRWILRLDEGRDQRVGGLIPLSAEREAIFQPICQEIETQTAILGISLNDAIDERNAGQTEIAWRLVRLAASEWDRLAEILTLLSKVMSKHAARTRVPIPTHSVTRHHFKSRVMVDFLRTHELLSQLVFRSKLRFQLHLRILRRAADSLSTEFRRAYRYADRTEDRPAELWTRLDFYFHDFDLVTKEALLTFRALLFCLPHSELESLTADLKPLVKRGVRATAVGAER
jgi:hypothetical protein